MVIESIGFRMSLTALYSQPDEVISILAVVIHRAYETGLKYCGNNELPSYN